MKRLFVVLIALAAVMALPQFVFAQPGGLLDGKIMNYGGVNFNVAGTTTAITDNNPATSRGYSGTFRPWYQFAENHTVGGYFAISTPDMILNLYDEARVLITSIPMTADGTTRSITPVNGVRYVMLTSPTGAGATYEFDLYESAEPDTTPPAVPAGLSGAEGIRKVDLTWTANTGDTAGYNVFVNDTKVNTALIATNHYTATNLTGGEAYKFEVSAVDTAGNESGKSGSIIKTPLSDPDTTPPNVPTALTGIAGNKQVTLSWSAGSDATGYYVYKNAVKIGSTPITAKTYVVGGLTNGTAYNFAVTAVDAVGNESAKSNTISKTPFATLNVHLVPNGTSIVVQLTGGTAPYTVTWGGQTETFNADTYVISGLSLNTDYVITVTDSDGLSYTGTVNTGGKIGYIPPVMPNPVGIFQRMIDGFGTAGKIGVAIIAAAISLGILIVLARWAWRLLKGWLAKAK